MKPSILALTALARWDAARHGERGGKQHQRPGTASLRPAYLSNTFCTAPQRNFQTPLSTYPTTPPPYLTSPHWLQYDCEEVFRLLEAEPGKRYLVEACVATTAQYGDRFRALVRQELRAVPGDGTIGERCDMHVKAVLVFIKDVNWALKKIIENGEWGPGSSRWEAGVGMA